MEYYIVGGDVLAYRGISLNQQLEEPDMIKRLASLETLALDCITFKQ